MARFLIRDHVVGDNAVDHATIVMRCGHVVCNHATVVVIGVLRWDHVVGNHTADHAIVVLVGDYVGNHAAGVLRIGHVVGNHATAIGIVVLARNMNLMVNIDSQRS